MRILFSLCHQYLSSFLQRIPKNNRSRWGWLRILLGKPVDKGWNNLQGRIYHVLAFDGAHVLTWLSFSLFTCNGVPAWKNLGLHASTPTCKAKVLSGFSPQWNQRNQIIQTKSKHVIHCGPITQAMICRVYLAITTLDLNIFECFLKECQWAK